MRTLITITKEEKEEMLIQTLKAQEMDLYIHTLNKERFQDMVLNLPEDNTFRHKLEEEILVIESRLGEVNATMIALEKQIPEDTDVPAVLVKLKAKEKEALNTR